MRFGPAQIEIAVTQSRFFFRVDFVFDRKWWSFRGVQYIQLARNQFYFAAWNLRICPLAFHDFAFDSHHILAASLFGLRVRLRFGFLVEHDLDEAGAIAHIQEQQVPQIAPPVDPSHHRRLAAGVGGAQRSAVVCPLQISQKVEHVISP